MARRDDIRNFAIIAHIDHGKTTLVDAMLAQAGVFRNNETVPERVLDSDAQERERGITIFAKNTAVHYRGVKLNILDTPGHADFGGEVERVLTLADGVVLLVDASEGPLPQTRFVLEKAIAAGLPPIVVLNKIDRKDARPEEVLDEICDLFIDLDASEGALDFPVLYAIARDGIARLDPNDDGTNLAPLFEAIVAHIPPPADHRDEPLRAIVANTAYDDYVGRIAIGRIEAGTLRAGQAVHLLGDEGRVTPGRVMRLYGFDGLRRTEVDEASSGDVFAVAGLDAVAIGDTIVEDAATPALPRIHVEPPTLRMTFLVNDSPFAGREGKYLTSRQLRERLFKAAAQNVSLRVVDGATPDRFDVTGRGELQLAVIVETMRREGYELQLSKPEVVTKRIDGRLHEPVEQVTIDVPEPYIGTVTEKLGPRGGRMRKMGPPRSGRVRLEFTIPSRGLIGFRSQFLTDTRGTGLLTSVVDGWAPHLGAIERRATGTIVSDRAGTTTPYALFHLEPRGILFVPPNTEVYEGMVIGEHTRENDLDVNAIREKKLTNFRAAGKDENVALTPPRTMTIEQAIEFIDEDELVEVTPTQLRLRKKQLACNIRPRRIGEHD